MNVETATTSNKVHMLIRTWSGFLAQVITGRKITIGFAKLHVVRVHIPNIQVAVGVVVSIWLVELGISQPPSAAVGGLPIISLIGGALHCVLGAATTTVGGSSHVNNQVRLARVVINAFAQGVVHDSPVVLVARRPDLETLGAGVRFSTLPNFLTVCHSEDIPGGVSGRADNRNFAAAWAADGALVCLWTQRQLKYEPKISTCKYILLNYVTVIA